LLDRRISRASPLIHPHSSSWRSRMRRSNASRAGEAEPTSRRCIGWRDTFPQPSGGSGSCPWLIWGNWWRPARGTGILPVRTTHGLEGRATTAASAEPGQETRRSKAMLRALRGQLTGHRPCHRAGGSSAGRVRSRGPGRLAGARPRNRDGVPYGPATGGTAHVCMYLLLFHPQIPKYPLYPPRSFLLTVCLRPAGLLNAPSLECSRFFTSSPDGPWTKGNRRNILSLRFLGTDYGSP
jgi:hypothetical protein